MSDSNGKTYGGKDALLQKIRPADWPTREVITNRGTFLIKAPTEREKSQILNGDNETIVARGIQLLTVDKDKHRIFTDDPQTLEDILALPATVTVPFDQALMALLQGPQGND